MFEIAISQMTTPRWELSLEVDRLAAHGFDAISVWRPKLSDLRAPAAAGLIAAAGLRVLSVQWAGGFTGGDGRSFDESVDDALEAIELAEVLSASVLVVHSGCRGGHTRSHARRLLAEAIELLAGPARQAGVTLAVKPMHPVASAGCSFVSRLGEAVELVEGFDDPAVRLALDLWHWADDPEIQHLLPRLAERTAQSDETEYLSWFCALVVNKKTTKKGKPYLQIVAIDTDGKHSVKVWSPGQEEVEPFSIWMANLKNGGEWGFSTFGTKLRRITVADGGVK